ncbi:MAG: hypothetical protein IJ877_00480 [Candidatus Gastranaerophilales bacterium]|nr:hypothetical protein [Candidatus Gastranaerophilales bacterium]
MELNKVVFGNFGLNAQKNNAEKSEAKEEAVKLNVGSEVKNVDAEAVFNAMNIAGAQNLAFVKPAEKKEIDPAEYLSAGRIADIEAMMGEFEDGVGIYVDALDEELPGFFAADAKYALAAEMFAQE